MSAWPVPPIETDRLLLRPFDARDRAVVLRMLTCPDTRAYLGGPVARAEALRRVAGPLGAEWGAFAICEEPTGVVVGSVAFTRDRGPLEVSWQLLPEHRGLGYATEAVQAALDWAFGVTGADEVVAVTPAANLRAAELARRVGMTQVKVLQEFGELQLGFRVTARDLAFA